MQRLRVKVFQSQDLSELGLLAPIPRYNILGEPLQVKITLSPGDERLELPALTLQRAQYELLAVTRIGRSSSIGQHQSIRTTLLWQHRSLNAPFPGHGSALHLHKVAPVILPISPNWTGSTMPKLRECAHGENLYFDSVYILILHGKASVQTFRRR